VLTILVIFLINQLAKFRTV